MTYIDKIRSLMALATASIAAFCLSCWLFAPASMKPWLGAQMKANTALGLVLCASAVLTLPGLARRGGAWVWYRRGVALFLLALGGATLIEYYWSANFGIDQWIATDFLSDESRLFPGRMSPNAAGEFVLFAAILLLTTLETARTWLWAQRAALVVIASAGIALLGYAFDHSELYRLGSFIRMSSYTAVAFFLLGMSVVLARRTPVSAPLFSELSGGILARSLLLPALLLPTLIGWGSTWIERMQLISGDMELILCALSVTLVFVYLVWSNSRSIDDAESRRLAAEEKERHAVLKAKAAAEAANRTKSQFLANMSHEIRTPLGVIDGLTALLSEAEPNPTERQEWTVSLRANIAMLTRLVDGILDLAKIEAERLDLELLPVSPRGLAAEVLAMLRVKAHEAGVELRLKVDPSVPPGICTDPTRLKQILLNIAGNALKFTQQGWIEMRLSWTEAELREAAGSKGRLIIHLQDTGQGMSDEQQARLFQPFSQADASMTRRYGGSGLGLFLSRQLAEALGGSLRLLASAPTAGSLFCCEIAAARVEVAPLPSPAAAARRGAVWAGAAELAGKAILHVDDVSENRLIVRRYLTASGASVDSAEHGRSGVDLALKRPYDAILMDIQMPEMDGFAAIHALRQHGLRTPVIALTAHAMQGERERCLQAGFDAYLVKPIDRSQLIDCVKQVHAAGASPG